MTLSEPAAAGRVAPTWSSEQFEQILGAVSDGVTVQDRSGAIVFANRPAVRVLGYPDVESLLQTTPGAVVGNFEVFDARGMRVSLADLPGRRALAGENPEEMLLRFRIPATGEERWARVAARPILAPDGSVELAVNTFHDVTESQNAAEQLTLQAGLLDEVEASVIATDVDGRVTHWNRAAERLFGWTLAEARGRLLTDTIEIPEGGDDTLADLRAGRRWEGEVNATRRDGHSVTAYVTLSPIRDDAGDVVGMVGAGFDVSERRLAEARLRMSEARYRTLADSLPHIVWTAGPDGLIDAFNERFVEYTGVRPEAASGWGWAAIVHPDDLPGLMQRWTNALSSGRELETEYRLRKADGGYRWQMARAVPLRDADGAILAWIGTSTDIEDRKHAERGLRFLAEASEVLNDSLDHEETLASVARLAVPEIADWCRVDLLSPEGRLEMVAVAHADPEKVALAREMVRRWPTRLDSETGVARVLRTGRPELTADFPDAMLDAIVTDPELREMLRKLGVRSSMIVPLLDGTRAIGAISFVAAESGRHFDANDLTLAEDLARRAAAAIDNASLYRRVSQFKGAVDNATDSIFMYDPETLRFSYVNRGAVEQVGYSADELLRMTPLDLKPEFDEARYRALIAPLVEGEAVSRSLQTVQRRKDGVLIPVDVVLQRIPIEPEGMRIIAFVRDVSDRVETQARLQRLAQAERARAAEVDAVIRAMGEAVVVFDADGLITLSNPAADDLLSGASVSRWDHVMELFDWEDRPAIELGKSHPQGPVELRMRGQRRWVEVTAYAVLVEALAPTAAVAPHTGVTILVMRDVTPQREAEAMREAFVGVLSHELRTPVTTIYGSSKVLSRLEGRLPEETRRDVYSDIEAEAERLYRLVEDLLVLARFGEDPVRLGDEPVLLQRILPPVVASEQARWATTRFLTSIPPGLPTVRADPTYVEQVARNLLANGAKYGRAGGTVTLSLETAPGEVVVRVRDQGPGFPPDEGERLFELFYRSPLTAGHAPGAGIGLFVCRRLIEAMGGRIWAHNLPEGGAEFGFTLLGFEEEE